MKRPNILFVFSFQHRWRDLGCYGNSEISSPYFDRLASEGLCFDSCISNCPICVPARGALLTGLLPLRHGAIGNDLRIRTDLDSIAEVLAGAGYHTGYIGKWHLAGVSRDQVIDLSGVLFDSKSEARDPVYLMDYTACHQPSDRGTSAWRGIRTANYLFAKKSNGEPWLLFDLKEDPMQLRNLLDQASPPAKLSDLTNQLDCLVEKHDVYLDPDDLITIWTARGVEPEPASFQSARDRRKMTFDWSEVRVVTFISFSEERSGS